MSRHRGSGLIVHGPAPAKDPRAAAQPTVQIAILLDTSNSMDGLIAQAKTQLWNVVNEFVRAQEGRPAAGHPGRAVRVRQDTRSPPSEGFVRLILPLTDDLDRVSEELFALKTNGGEEYCGWVIRDAVKRLEWSGSRDVYKAIFIAGQRAVHAGAGRFPRLVPSRHRARDHREHDLLRPESRRDARPAGKTARSWPTAVT